MENRKNASPKCCKIGIFIRNMLIYQEHMKLNSALAVAVINAVTQYNYLSSNHFKFPEHIIHLYYVHSVHLIQIKHATACRLVNVM